MTKAALYHPFNLTGASNLVLTGNGGAGNAYTGGTTVNLGTLTLDFGYAGAPANDIINAGSALTMYGGTLQVTGKASTVNSQTFNGLSVTGGGAIKGTDSGAGGNLTVALGAISRTSPGTIAFTKPATGNITTTTPNDGTTGILGPWAATGGTDFATNSGGNVVGLAAAANDTEATWDTTGAANLNFTAGNTLSASRSLYTMRYSGANDNALSLGGAGTAYNLTTNALLMGTGGKTLTINRNATATGALTIGAATGELIIGGGIVDGNIAVQVPISGSGKLIKTGANTVTINTNALNFTGSTYVTLGKLSLGLGSALGTSDPTVMSGGKLSADFASALSGRTVTVNDGGIVASTAANAFNGTTINVNAGGLVQPYNVANGLGGATINLTGGTLDLNNNGDLAWGGAVSVSADSAILVRGGNTKTQSIGSLELKNGARLLAYESDAELGVTGTLTMTGNGTLDIRPVNTYTSPAKFNVISGSGTLTKTGAETLAFQSAASGFTGNVTADRGVVRLDVASALSGGSATVNNGGVLYPNTAFALNGVNTVTVNPGGVLQATLPTTNAFAGLTSGTTPLIVLNGGGVRVDGGNVAATALGGNFRVDADSTVYTAGGNSQGNSIGTVAFSTGTRLTAIKTADSPFSIRNVTLPVGGGTARVTDHFDGKSFNLGGDQLNSTSLPSNTGTITYTGATTLQMDGSTSTALAIRGLLAGGSNLLTIQPDTAQTQLGDAVFSLSGTGGLQVKNGYTLKSGAANQIYGELNVPNAPSTVFNLNAFNLAIGPLTGGGASGSGDVNNSGAAKTLTVGITGVNGTYAGVLKATTATNLLLAKTGSGTQTLTNASTFTGGTTFGAGTLKLDYDAGVVTSNILASGSGITSAGGTLLINGDDTNPCTQTLGTFTVNSGAGSLTAASNGQNMNTVLGGMTRNAYRGTVSFGLPALGSITTTQNNDASGILGPWAFVGTQYAYRTGVSGTAIGAYTGTSAVPDSWASNTTNFEFTDTTTQTLSGNRTANTARYNNTGVAIDLGNSGTNTLTLNGLLNSGTGPVTIQRSGGTGTVNAGSTNELILAGAAPITISAPIANNGANASALVYSGTDTLTLSGENTYTGGTVVNSGTLKLGSATTIPNPGTTGATPYVAIQGGGITNPATLDLAGYSPALAVLRTDVGATYAWGDNRIINKSGSTATLTLGNYLSLSQIYNGAFYQGTGLGNAGIKLVKTCSNTQTLANHTTLDSDALTAIDINEGTLAVGTGTTNVWFPGALSSTPAQMQQTLGNAGSAPITVNRNGTLLINSLSTCFGPWFPNNPITVKSGGTFTYNSSIAGTIYTKPITLESGGRLGGTNVTYNLNGTTLPREGFLFNDVAANVTSSYVPGHLSWTLAFQGAGAYTCTPTALNISSVAGEGRTLAFNGTGGLLNLNLNADLTIAGVGNGGYRYWTPAFNAGASLGTLTGAYSLIGALAPTGRVAITPVSTGITGGVIARSGVIVATTTNGYNNKVFGATGVTLQGGAVRIEGPGANNNGTATDTIAVGAGGGALELIGNGDGGAVTYAGTLSGSAPLTLRYGSLGTGSDDSYQNGNLSGYTGNVTVECVSKGDQSGSVLVFKDSNAMGGTGATWNIPVGAMFSFASAFTPGAGDYAKLTVDSGGESVLDARSRGQTAAINLNAMGQDVRVGQFQGGGFTYTGAFTPFSDAVGYKFAPCTRSGYGFTFNTALVDGGASRKLDLRPSAASPLHGDTDYGIFQLTSNGSYSGSTNVDGVILNALCSQGNAYLTRGASVQISGTQSATPSVTVNRAATLELRGTAGAFSFGTGTLTVKGGGIFNHGDTATVANNNGLTTRTGANWTLVLGDGSDGRGTFAMVFPAATFTHAQTFPKLTLSAGANVITTAGTVAGTANLIFGFAGGAGYTRNVGAIVNSVPATGFNPQCTNAPTVAGGSSVSAGTVGVGGLDPILIGATLNSADFIKAAAGNFTATTYDTQNGAAAWGTGPGHDGNINNGAAYSGTTLAGAQSINSLKSVFAANGAFAIGVGAGDSLSIKSGMVLHTPNNTLAINGPGSLTSGNGQDLAFAVTQSTVTVNAPILGGLALTKSGGGTLALANAGNAIGDVYLNGGTLSINAVGALPTSGTHTYNLMSGTLNPNVTTAGMTFGSNITLAVSPQNGWISTGTTSGYPMTFQGPVTLNGFLGFSAGSGGSGCVKTFAGNITGPGMIGFGKVPNGKGLLVFTGDNPNWSGGIRCDSTFANSASGAEHVRFSPAAPYPNNNSAGTGPIVFASANPVGGVYFDTTSAGATTFSNNLLNTTGQTPLVAWGLHTGLSDTGTDRSVTLSGKLYGTYGLVLQGYATADNLVSEMALAGTLGMTGAGGGWSYGGATSAQNFNNGVGGVTLGVTNYQGTTAVSAQNLLDLPVSTANNGALGFVRFANAQSFIPGAVGPGYLSALRRAGLNPAATNPTDQPQPGRFGYLLTGTGGAGTTYTLPEGKSFLIGSLGPNGTTNQVLGTLGVTGTGTCKATLLGGPEKSRMTGIGTSPSGNGRAGHINIHANGANDTQGLYLFTRGAGSTLVLGDGSNPVVFCPTTGDSGGTSAFTVLAGRTGLTTLTKKGAGTLRVANTDVLVVGGAPAVAADDARDTFAWVVDDSSTVVYATDDGAKKAFQSFTINPASTLQLDAGDNRLPILQALTDNGTFDLNTRSQELTGLTGAGVVQNADGGGSPILTLNVAGSLTVTTPLGTGGTSFGLTKKGVGTLELNTAHTYTGLTTVNAGTLGGTGSIAGALLVNAGILAPGAAATPLGTFSVGGGATFGDGSRLLVNIDNDGTPKQDLLAITGALDLSSGTDTIEIAATGAGLVTGNTYVVATYTPGSRTGTFDTVVGLSGSWVVDYSTDGQVVVKEGGATFTVTLVNPDNGPAAGGTSVTVSGTGFATSGLVTVDFGGSAATDLVITATTIVCNTSPHAGGGAVVVTVINPDSTTAAWPDPNRYTYNLGPAPTDIVLDPNTGPSSGGQDVTVTGSGFESGATVTFDLTSTVGSTFVSSTALTCVTPAHAVGPVGVTVTNPYGLTSDPGDYTYFDNWEGDVAPRRIGGGAGGGDNDVSVADWVQIGRFAAKLDTPVSGIEFQKADCAGDEANPPIGDGDVSVADWVKCGRYAAKLDAKLTAQGPTGL